MNAQQERTADVLRDLESAVQELHDVTVRIRQAIEVHEAKEHEGDDK